MCARRQWGYWLFGIVSFLLGDRTARADDSVPTWGMFSQDHDIGNPAIAGSSTYDPAKQSYSLSAGGKNMWAERDEFHLLALPISGDFIVRASVQFVGAGVDPHRKFGIIARDSTSAGSRYADAAVHGDGLTSLQFRAAEDGPTAQVKHTVLAPTEIEFRRVGNTFTFSAAQWGDELQPVRQELDLQAEVLVGLYVCSHRVDVKEQAIFHNVRVEIPAPADLVPYRQYIGSRLETMNVATGERKILKEFPGSIQAPNWTTDNQSLIYNAEGLLYRYSLRDGSVAKLNTGLADKNNNDHVLSFDGQQLAISSASGTSRNSTIFVLPVSGSDQLQKITDETKGAADMHGWSPDGQTLVYTGVRDKVGNIYAIDLKTGQERRLTDQPALDDGPEYSPNGQFIYFNSARSGTMQIWRMQPDGGHPEQMTKGERQDWFPHLSPDGQQLVFISFAPEVGSTDHPFYQHVSLHIMPSNGGPRKTIATLYGGQGTINVPSWSPDGTHIAFVSNSVLPLAQKK